MAVERKSNDVHSLVSPSSRPFSEKVFAEAALLRTTETALVTRYADYHTKLESTRYNRFWRKSKHHRPLGT